MPHVLKVISTLFLVSLLAAISYASEPLHVGAAAVDIPVDDSMEIAGGILPWKANGQEGKLRASSVVLQLDSTRVAIVSCDVLFVQRDFADRAATEIENKRASPQAIFSFTRLIHTQHPRPPEFMVTKETTGLSRVWSKPSSNR